MTPIGIILVFVFFIVGLLIGRSITSDREKAARHKFTGSPLTEGSVRLQVKPSTQRPTSKSVPPQ